MATIELKNISHSYELESCDVVPADCDMNSGFVIRDLDLTWETGSANALLGPSGCGKTTILNIISGLLKPTMGQILYDGKEVTHLPAEKRRIAQVFQFPVVYDTMSVYDNLAFPLKNAGMAKADIKTRVLAIAEVLELEDVLKAAAGKISQANKQKVSLGRGIVRKDTVAILFDEPLTVIDPKEKYVLRRKIRQVQKDLNITTIYVTHDQHEALTFADRVTVLSRGRVVQTGSPEELHAEPQSPFIGYFIGSPGMNLLDCELSDRGLQFAEFALPISPEMRGKIRPHGPKLQVGIRPEFIEVSTSERAGWQKWQVALVENQGSFSVVTLASDGVRIKSRVGENTRVGYGDMVWTRFPEGKIKVFKDDRRIF